MMRVYRIPLQSVRHEKRRLAAAIITLFVTVPASIGLITLYFRLDPRTLTLHDLAGIVLGLGVPCAALWVQTLTLSSLQIELEDDRIRKIQNRPFGLAPSELAFAREEIAHIREVGKSGMMIHGRDKKGRYIDLQIPRTIENYDELRGRLTAWFSIQDSWM